MRKRTNRFLTESAKITEAYLSTYRRMSESSEEEKNGNEDIVAEFRETLNGHMPCFEFGDDVVYFEYDPKRNVLAYGGATNSGLAEEGFIEYDRGISMAENLANLYDKLWEEHGHTEEG